MTAKKVVQGLIVTAALCLSTNSVRAQGYRVFIMGADSVFTDKRSFTEGTLPYTSGYAGGGKGIAGFEAPIYKIFGIEGSYGYGRNNLEITNFNYTYPPMTGYGVKFSRISADIVGHAPVTWRGISVYGVLGLEYDLFSPTSAAQELAKTRGFIFAPTATLSSQGKEGFNVGLGVDYKVAWRIDLRFDARDHLFGSPTYGVPQSSTTLYAPFFPVGGPAHDIEYSIGLVFRFGKRK
jgi:hypothetical protein